MTFLSLRPKASRNFSSSSSASDSTAPPLTPVPPPLESAQSYISHHHQHGGVIHGKGTIETLGDAILLDADDRYRDRSDRWNDQRTTLSVSGSKKQVGQEVVSTSSYGSRFDYRPSTTKPGTGAGVNRGHDSDSVSTSGSASDFELQPPPTMSIFRTRTGSSSTSSNGSPRWNNHNNPNSRDAPEASPVSSRSVSGRGSGSVYDGISAQGHGSPVTPRIPSASGRKAVPAFGGEGTGAGAQQRRGALDEDDRVAYEYALRVAALYAHLSHPTHSTPQTHSVPIPDTPPTTESTPSIPRRKSFAFLRSPSSAGAASGEGEAPIKLPKEFLIEFWQVLASAPPPALSAEGQAAWSTAKSGFLKGIKKGSRSESGGNLRDIGVLLETFASYLPSGAAAIAYQHKHATHLLSLLSSSLLRSSYFSPMAKQLTEKDKKLLADIKAEIQTYSNPTTNPASSSGGPTSVAPKRSTSSPADHSAPPVPHLPPPVPSLPSGGGAISGSAFREASRQQHQKHQRVSSAAQVLMQGQVEHHTNDTAPAHGNARRRPSSDPAAEESIQMVGLIFGVRRETWDRDLAEIRSMGDLEQLYIFDLQRSLSTLTSLSSPTSSQRARIDWLRSTLSTLQRPSTRSSTEPSAESFFFIPPNRARAFARLSARASENLALAPNTRSILSRCKELWGVSSLPEREREVEALVAVWCRSVSPSTAAGMGSMSNREERAVGLQLCEGIDDLVALSSDGEGEIPRVISELGSTCVKLLDRSMDSIWNYSASGNVPGPPLSLLPLLKVGNGVLVRGEKERVALEEIVDTVRAMAVGEYVRVLGDCQSQGIADGRQVGVGASPGVAMAMSRGGANSGAAVGYATVGRWIEDLVRGVKRSWGRGLGSAFDPAGIILSKQLPLFFAELPMLDDAPSEQVIALYRVVGQLCDLWDELCEGQEHGFEPHAFFEPFVVGWIEQIAESQVQVWVSRAVGMDDWSLSTDEQDEDKHSQSVDDLFESLSQAVKVVLEDIPVSKDKRAGLLADMAKVTCLAMRQYASTVHALYDAEVCPDKQSQAYQYHANGADGAASGQTNGGANGKFNDRIAGKASGWLSKGQQAVKGLEKKRVEGFILPRSACVKLADMSAATRAVEVLGNQLQEAAGPGRYDAAPRSPRSPTAASRQLAGPAMFTVTIVAGENLHTKQGKAADAFVVVTERDSGERLMKTRTVLGEDARWCESFDRSTTRLTTLEVAVYDRSLVGKHDPIGTGTIHLDPRSPFGSKTILVPLSPNKGIIRIILSTDGGEKRAVHPHIDTASALLLRNESRMADECNDRIMEFIGDQMSAKVLTEMTRPKVVKKGLGGMGMSLGGGGGGAVGKVAPETHELEASLGEVFGCLNANFAAFSSYLSPSTRTSLMLSLWHRLLEHFISLIVPPLSDLPFKGPLLSAYESDIVFKWLQMLKSFFNAKEDDGVEYGVPLSALQAGRYRDVLMLGQYMDLPSSALRERVGASVRAVGGTGSVASGQAGIEGLVKGLQWMGIGERGEGERMAEILLRITRTRSDMADFLGQQVGLYNRARLERQGQV